MKTLTIQGFKSCEHVNCWEPEWSVSNNYNHRPRSDSDRAVFRKAQCGSWKKRLRQEQFLRRSVTMLRDWRASITKLNIFSHPVCSVRCLHFYVSRGTSIPSSRGCFYFNYSFCIWYVCMLPDSLFPFRDICSCLQSRSSSTTLTIGSQLGETKSSSVEQSVSRRMNTVLTRRVLVRLMSWTFLRVRVSAKVIPTILFHKEGYVPLSYSSLRINTKTQLRSLHWQMRKITNV